MSTTKNHPNSKKITIFRAGSFINDAQTNAQEFLALSKKSIGSYFAQRGGTGIGTGLSFEEIDILMPLVLDIPKDDRMFREKVRSYFTSLCTKVDHSNGITLEVGLEKDNNAKVSADNLPIKLFDYIRYRHAIKHPKVAMSKEAANGDQTKEYYIFDVAAVEDANVQMDLLKETAQAEYFRIKDDEHKVIQLLTVLGEDPRKYTGKNAAVLRRTALKTLADTKADKFMEQLRDKHFEYKYLVKAMENTGVIRAVGSQFIDGETNEILANNREEMEMFFGDKTKSSQIVLLKARLQEQLKGLTNTKPALATAKVEEEEQAEDNPEVSTQKSK